MESDEVVNGKYTNIASNLMTEAFERERERERERGIACVQNVVQKLGQNFT